VVTAPIIGPRTGKQLDETLPVPDIELSVETLKKLDELFPGPGGEAPWAYAW
jgi:aryl-alcohol dehydrogenase-like predicted oxidoreductase